MVSDTYYIQQLDGTKFIILPDELVKGKQYRLRETEEGNVLIEFVD
jgi:hypothetical protein